MAIPILTMPALEYFSVECSFVRRITPRRDLTVGFFFSDKFHADMSFVERTLLLLQKRIFTMTKASAII